ncbi:MAG TPA: hypothetical protein VJ873_12210 [bacterium]|nr:hypothetical protein [bacterium]
MRDLRTGKFVYHQDSMVQGKVVEVRDFDVVVQISKTMPLKVWRISEIGMVEDLIVETSEESSA